MGSKVSRPLSSLLPDSTTKEWSWSKNRIKVILVSGRNFQIKFDHGFVVSYDLVNDSNFLLEKYNKSKKETTELKDTNEIKETTELEEINIIKWNNACIRKTLPQIEHNYIDKMFTEPIECFFFFSMSDDDISL